MKRGLKIVGLLLAVLVLVPVGFLVATFAGNPELKDGLEPASGVRLVKPTRGDGPWLRVQAAPVKLELVPQHE